MILSDLELLIISFVLMMDYMAEGVKARVLITKGAKVS